MKIVKYDGNLYFGSAENFRRALYRKTKLNPRKLREQRKKLCQESPDQEALLSVMSEIRHDQEVIEMENQEDEYTLPVRRMLLICLFAKIHPKHNLCQGNNKGQKN